MFCIDTGYLNDQFKNNITYLREYNQNNLEALLFIDVLEHVEEEFMDTVFNELKDITNKLAFFTIALQPAGKTLKDGRNAHITLKPDIWWLKFIEERFNIISLKKSPNRLKVLVQKK